ncbi:hypothetical protein D3C76_530350 [compost metagenome]
MNRLRRMFSQAFAIPSTKQALFAIAMWPILYAAACYETQQLADYLSEFVGIHISMMKLYVAGCGAYCLLLSRHRLLNNRYFVRYAANINRHRELTMLQQGMVAAGLAHRAEYQAVIAERDEITGRLGFLVDADNFYRKLNGLVDLMRKGVNELGRFVH